MTGDRYSYHFKTKIWHKKNFWKKIVLIFVVRSLSHVWLFATPWLQHTRLPCPSPSPRVCSNSCPLIQWCHPTTSSSIAHFFFCPQSFPATGSFPASWLFTSGGQSIGASASASVLPMNIQGWFPLGLTGLIPLQSKGLSRVFSSTTVQEHQFFGTDSQKHVPVALTAPVPCGTFVSLSISLPVSAPFLSSSLEQNSLE